MHVLEVIFPFSISIVEDHSYFKSFLINFFNIIRKLTNAKKLDLHGSILHLIQKGTQLSFFIYCKLLSYILNQPNTSGLIIF